MKKNTITLIITVVLTLITGTVAFYISQNRNASKSTKSVTYPKISKSPSKVIKDTTTAKHTIVIENVDDPRQLQEILTLLESYSAEHEIKDLSITTNKDNILK